MSRTVAAPAAATAPDPATAPATARTSARRSEVLRPGALLTSAIMLPLTLIVGLPFYYIVVNTFKTQAETAAAPLALPTVWRLDTYTRVLESVPIVQAFGNTLLVTAVSIVLMLLIGSLAAFSVILRRSRFITIVFVIAFLVPGQVTLIPLYRLFAQLGLVDSLWGLILMYTAGSVFCYFLIVGYMRTIPGEMIEAAKLDGASNDFLRSAGYRYIVRIEPSDDSYRMLLEHEDAPGHIEAAASHLSYGEKNAFALVLFMHHVQRAKPDLVVLDDPISSFDKTKKFAILHQLFHGSNSLRHATSLLLTHDIEPAIDIVRTGTSGQFREAAPVVHFLVGRSGTVSETPINSTDIQTFSQVCESNIAEANDAIIKSIYLRRLLEIHGSKGPGYQLLANLVHLRDTPIQQLGTGNTVIMTQEEIDDATAAIMKHIPDFDYAKLLVELRDTKELKEKFNKTDVGYEKVQLFRIMAELHPETLKGDDVFKKFINESYHIENEYVMQLNPKSFDAVPEYVVAACTSLLQKI